MKVKPVYIYLVVFVIVVIALVVITSGGNPSESTTPNVSNQSEMPKDDIHKNLGNAPGSGNVSSEFKQKMANMKSEYESNPSDTVNAKEYARLLAAAHNPQEAVNVYNSILHKDSKRIDIRIELATVYYNMQKYEEAKKQIEAVIEAVPDESGAYYNLGAIEAAQGNIDKAKEIWQKVVEQFPNTEAANLANTSLQKIN